MTITDRWKRAKTTIDATQALSTARGGLQLDDPRYDTAEKEPDDPPPSSAQQPRYTQPNAPNWGYASGQRGPTSQSTPNLPNYRYDAFAATQNYQALSQNHPFAQQQTSPPPQNYGNAQQFYSPPQSQQPYTHDIVGANSGYMQHGYTQPGQTTHDYHQQSPFSGNSSSPPQPAYPPPSFAPLQRSATDYYQPQPSYDLHRSYTMPAQTPAQYIQNQNQYAPPPSHNCHQHWDP